MKTVSEEFVNELIDFAPSERARQMGFAEAQIRGTTAAYNMLTRNGVAYIADEVGMGKTYVALGVMGLLRHQFPAARVLVIAPRENIQQKWIKELRNFVHENWRVEDNRVRNLHNEPARTPLACGSFEELARSLRIRDNADLFLRATTFSLAIKQHEGRQKCRNKLLPYVPWVDKKILNSRDYKQFRDMYGRVLNALMPPIDLLIIDEAHNFKHGFGEHVSNRNRVLGMALGHPDGGHPDCAWYGPRVKRVLMLSATPFEYDYADLYRQLNVFGWGNKKLKSRDGQTSVPVKRLLEGDEDEKRELVKRFLIRRVQYLNIGGKRHSKNMYRREWRQGGYELHDNSMKLEDPRQRLVVGLIQKKVSEILGDRRFNNNFQIGMLSSFESFMESLSRSKRKHVLANGSEEEEDGEAVFDGNQDATNAEKIGVDSHSLEHVVSSYRKIFGHSLPHPKLDATVTDLADAFSTGEKALIFVRRIATVTELKAKLDDCYDSWIRQHMEQTLPELRDEIDGIFNRYIDEKRNLSFSPAIDQPIDEKETLHDERAYDLDEDEGSTESFFSWFFRGSGPKGILSGAAFQKNRLASVSSAYATFFEDDHIAWLLGRPTDAISAIADQLQLDKNDVTLKLRRLAYGYFHKRTTRRDGYPRLYVFEAYQVAALILLSESNSEQAKQVGIILQERYGSVKRAEIEVPSGFPEAVQAFGVKTFFTELVKRDMLRNELWPDYAKDETFRDHFRRREQRRELISAMARLGASYVDLYLLAIRALGSFNLRKESDKTRPEGSLVDQYLDLLETQMAQSKAEGQFTAYRELRDAAKAFDTLVGVNFPEIRNAPLGSYATIFGRALNHQQPVGRVFGGVNKRLVKQFRMPGYPLVLVTTDVLQEGEDLHTFCRRVIHYGISWTPSAMEQRTGRVDRIGSLVQRQLDGRKQSANPDDLIQVYYPHLEDTVERLQIRRVLERLNKFMHLIHHSLPEQSRNDSSIDIATEILRKDDPVPCLQGLLESEFPVTEHWLGGELGSGDVNEIDLDQLKDHFQRITNQIVSELGIHIVENPDPRSLSGVVAIFKEKVVPWGLRENYPGHRQQSFELSLRSQLKGSATLIRCLSPVGMLDLTDDENIDSLYELQRDLGMVCVCADYDMRHRPHTVSVKADRLFALDTTQYEELRQIVLETVLAADKIEEKMLQHDEDPVEFLDLVTKEQDE